MNRLVVVGLVGIAVLTTVGLAAVALLDRRPPVAAPPAVAPAAPTPAATARPPPSPQSQPPSGPPPEPDTDRAQPIDPRKRLRMLGPLRRDTLAGLEDLAPSVQACRLPNAALMLTLETQEGRARVVAVVVRPAGADTAEVTGVSPAPLDENGVRCVKIALEGHVLDVPSAHPGRRWDMPWAPGLKP